MDWSTTYIYRAVLVVVLTYLLWKITRFITKYRKWRAVSSSPEIAVVGPLHPIWGSLHKFQSSAELFKYLYKTMEEKKPKMYCIWLMFLYPGFGVCHPDTVQVLYKSSEPKSTGVGGIYRYLRDWIGDGLLISEGKKWERNRRLLTPGFHFDILKPYIKVYNNVTDIFLKKLEHYADKNEAVDIFPHVALATLDTILRCAFSYQENIQEKGENHPYVHAVKRLSYLTLSRCMKPWFQIDLIHMLSSEGRELRKLCDYSHNFSERIIRERKQTLVKEGPPTKRYLDFLDILLTAKDENGIGLSDEDIRAEVDTFLFEDLFTCNATFILFNHTNCHRTSNLDLYLYVDENEDLFKIWENVQNLPRLTAFVKESMRMYAPVPGTVRRLTKPMKFGDVELPAGVHVDINIHLIHHHPDVWPDHETFSTTQFQEFKPERFIKEDIIDRHPYSYIPFAAGSRNCIGQNFAMNEIKVMIARLVQRYKVSLVPGHNYEINPEVVMRAQDGIKITLQSR